MPADLRIHMLLNVKRSLFQVRYGLPSVSWWLALSVTPCFYLLHTFPCLRLQRPLGVEKWKEGKVERTSMEESDLNSSCCTPFTFTDRHRTHTHTLASVPDLTKPSLLRAKVKQMQSSHCYSLNKRVRMNKQRPSGGRNIAEWMRCWERGQGEVTVTMSEPQLRPLVVNSRQQVDRWCDWSETSTTETFWCYLYLQRSFSLIFRFAKIQFFWGSRCLLFNLSLSFTLVCSSLHKPTPVHFLPFCLEWSSLSLTGATEVQCLRQQMVAYLTWLRHLPYKIIIEIKRTFNKWNV